MMLIELFQIIFKDTSIPQMIAILHVIMLVSSILVVSMLENAGVETLDIINMDPATCVMIVILPMLEDS